MQKAHEDRELTTADGEDRLILTPDGWYWQTRGYRDLHGPFATIEEAAADCERELDDFAD